MEMNIINFIGIVYVLLLSVYARLKDTTASICKMPLKTGDSIAVDFCFEFTILPIIADKYNVITAELPI